MGNLEGLGPVLLEDPIRQGFSDSVDPGPGIVLTVQFLFDILERCSPGNERFSSSREFALLPVLLFRRGNRSSRASRICTSKKSQFWLMRPSVSATVVAMVERRGKERR